MIVYGYLKLWGCSTPLQGFASGDLDEDAYAPRYFAERGMEFMVAQVRMKFQALQLQVTLESLQLFLLYN